MKSASAPVPSLRSATVLGMLLALAPVARAVAQTDDPGWEEEIVPGLEEEVVPGLEEEVVPGLEEEVVPGLEEEVVPGEGSGAGWGEGSGAPAPSPEPPTGPAPADGAPPPAAPADADDAYYEQFWDQLDRQSPAPAPVEAPPAAGAARVVGLVLDDEFGTPLADVTVTIDGTDLRTATGADGRFAVDVPPGDVVVRLSLLSYAPLAYQLEVTAESPSDLGTIRMGVDEVNSATEVVEGRAIRENAATQLMERREAAAVSDAVSAEEIAKAPDGAASDAVKRVVGATIVDDQFLYIRGLGGRYTCVTMNGVLIRGTDPDFPGVQLDIFPSDLLSNLTIYKSFSPELSGGCAAGQMDIGTRDYPEDRRVTLGVSLSGDTETTGATLRTDAGGSTDWLGMDDGTRALPGDFPDARVELGRGLSREQTDEAGRSLRDQWEPDTATALPGFGLKGSVGDSGEAGGRRWGYLVMANYGQRPDHDVETLRSVTRASDGKLAVEEELKQETDRTRLRWGALATGTLGFGENHQFTLATLWSQSASSRVSWTTTDSSSDKGRPYENRRMEWLERSFWFTQLLGRHRGLWLDSELAWNSSLLVANREEPDTRFLKRDSLNDVWRWRPDPGSGERFFSGLDQLDASGGLDWKMPLGLESRLSLGADAQGSTRDFDARRFRFNCTRCEEGDPRALPPEELFGDEHIGKELLFSEETGWTDQYRVEQRLLAGYSAVDLHTFDWLRVTGGVRWEGFAQTVTSGSPFSGRSDLTQDSVERDDADLLPAAGLVFSLSDAMFVRASYGASVARPQGREMAPFVYQDYVRRKTITGNPELTRTYVHSADLRWEWFPGPSEVLAASVFYKQPLHPIEQSYTLAGEIAYTNVDAARNLGIELESRFSLGRLALPLAPLQVGANVTLVSSEVSLSADQQRAATHASRPMQGQADFVVNASLGWEPAEAPWSVRLLYNVVGKELQTVGLVGLPDVYSLPFHRLDAVASWKLSDAWKLGLSVRNLLLASRVSRQGDVKVEEQTEPLEGALSVSWSPAPTP